MLIQNFLKNYATKANLWIHSKWYLPGFAAAGLRWRPARRLAWYSESSSESSFSSYSAASASSFGSNWELANFLILLFLELIGLWGGPVHPCERGETVGLMRWLWSGGVSWGVTTASGRSRLHEDQWRAVTGGGSCLGLEQDNIGEGGKGGLHKGCHMGALVCSCTLFSGWGNVFATLGWGLSEVPLHRDEAGDREEDAKGCWCWESSSSSSRAPQNSRGRDGKEMARCLWMGLICPPEACRTSESFIPPHSVSFSDWSLPWVRSCGRGWGMGVWGVLSDFSELSELEVSGFIWAGGGGPRDASWVTSHTSSWLSVSSIWTVPGCSLQKWRTFPQRNVDIKQKYVTKEHTFTNRGLYPSSFNFEFHYLCVCVWDVCCNPFKPWKVGVHIPNLFSPLLLLIVKRFMTWPKALLWGTLSSRDQAQGDLRQFHLS